MHVTAERFNEVLRLRISAGQLRVIRAAARAEHMTLSEFVRQAASASAELALDVDEGKQEPEES